MTTVLKLMALAYTIAAGVQGDERPSDLSKTRSPESAHRFLQRSLIGMAVDVKSGSGETYGFVIKKVVRKDYFEGDEPKAGCLSRLEGYGEKIDQDGYRVSVDEGPYHIAYYDLQDVKIKGSDLQLYGAAHKVGEFNPGTIHLGTNAIANRVYDAITYLMDHCSEQTGF